MIEGAAKLRVDGGEVCGPGIGDIVPASDFLMSPLEDVGPVRYRKLRIVWSVGCGILCLFVIVFWVRSYRWFDEVAFYIDNSRSLVSIQSTWKGSLSLGWSDSDPQLASGYYARLFNARTRESMEEWWHSVDASTKAGKFDSYFTSSVWYVAVPFWFLGITLGILTVAPWVRRFTLRTMLLATAVIAAIMGVAVATS